MKIKIKKKMKIIEMKITIDDLKFFKKKYKRKTNINKNKKQLFLISFQNKNISNKHKNLINHKN